MIEKKNIREMTGFSGVFGCLAARCGVDVTYLHLYIFVIFDVKY